METTRWKRHALLALSLIYGTSAAHAEHGAGHKLTEADFLDELPVVLSVSRLSQPVNETPAAVTVIDRDTIHASGFRDIPELLRLVPGFAVAYTRDNTWAVAYHGVADAFSRRFQVLVDGRSIYNAAYGTVYWAEQPLSIDDIERIEVVRGPNAASHGANAFFAVINLITKTAAQTPGAHVSLQYGEQGMAGLTARYGGGHDRLRWRLTFSAQNRDRFETDTTDTLSAVPKIIAPEKLFEETRTYFVAGRADYQISATDEVSAQFGWTEGDWQSGRFQEPAEPRRQDVRAQFAQFKFSRAIGSDHEWSVQFYHSRNRIDAPAQAEFCFNNDAPANSRTCAPGLPMPPYEAVGPVDADIDLMHRRTNLELGVNNRLAENTRLAWGLEVRHDEVASRRYFNRSDSLSGSLARAHANLEWHATPRWLIQGGAMLEHHHYVGTDVSPRVAVNYTLAEGHTLRTGVSQAYRTPTFFEQEGDFKYDTPLGPLQLTSPANGSLAPERILSREVGYVGKFAGGSLQVDARLFRDSVYDFIENATGQYANQGDFRLQGGELQFDWQPLVALRLHMGFARVFIRSGPELDNDLPTSAPVNSGNLFASYQFSGGWAASAGVYHTGYMKWLNDGDTNPAYTRLDLRLARRGEWNGVEWEAALVGQNLGGDHSEFRVENRVTPRVYGSVVLSW